VVTNLGLHDAQGDMDYDHARRLAFWNAVLAFVTGRTNRLLSWEAVSGKLGVRERIYRGLQSVPLAKIVGSVGRFQDFDRAFMPTTKGLAARWRSIAQAHYDDVSLPPIKLYRVGDVFFVLDGNHRVSVAKEQGIRFIDAEVTEIETRVPVRGVLDADNLEIKGEYVRFLEQTQLDRLRPDQHIEFTIGGGYDRLLELIALHRLAMGEEGQRSVSDGEAVADWYDHEYVPLIQIIRDQAILVDFPGRTEADLYLWITDHQHVLRELCGPSVIIERAAQRFAERHAAPPIRRAAYALRDLLSNASVECTLVTEGRLERAEK
jgi:hypothetical protein